MRRWQRRRTMNKAQVKNVINVPVFHYFPISSLQKRDYVPNPTKVRPLLMLLHLCDSENRGLTLVRLLCVKFGWIGSLVMERKKFLFFIIIIIIIIIIVHHHFDVGRQIYGNTLVHSYIYVYPQLHLKKENNKASRKGSVQGAGSDVWDGPPPPSPCGGGACCSRAGLQPVPPLLHGSEHLQCPGQRPLQQVTNHIHLSLSSNLSISIEHWHSF